MPSFFFTKTRGVAQGLVEGWIMFLANISFTLLAIHLRRSWAARYGLKGIGGLSPVFISCSINELQPNFSGLRANTSPNSCKRSASWDFWTFVKLELDKSTNYV